MSLFIDQTSDFEVEVKYVFGEDDSVHILTDDDAINLSKTDEEKEKIEFEREDLDSAIPFNKRVDLGDYKTEDIKVAKVKFRKPAFDDVHVLMSSFSSGDMANISPGELFEFNNRRIRILFKKGEAQDKEGKTHRLTQKNISSLSPALGSAIAVGMNEHMNMD